ncbi:MAG: nitrous oxide reductase family maturation protein NosD [Leptospirales bacterium]|nr:nitrous oxide reductase family maturation protein NosD [Leptospirales bacterium]HMU85743.1 nitrous oxide reductase family maturation protein NosD [Leptospiraceae bacterium]HNJ34001.1 nitrous oxide reductase family maturation protein NosD [Leptospiraceae bacterium]HNN61274.1 nitrous oxide reductase family maturation protein NosD [Leptospiraceae bacterium]
MKRLSFSAFLLCLSSVTINAAVLRVCESCAVRKISDAIHLARPADTIEIDGGTYHEGIIRIFKPLRIVGIHHPVIDGDKNGHVIYVSANDVSIEGLVVRNSGISDLEEFAGIYVDHSQRCRIISNHLEENTYGVYLAYSSGCVLQDNSIVGAHHDEITAGNGVHLYSVEHIQVFGNDVSGHRDGLYFEFATLMQIESNKVYHNLRYGMHFMFSHDNDFANNLFQDNPTGCALMYSRHLKVHENHFEKSLGFAAYGLLLKDIQDSEFTKNIFSGNTVAVYMEGATRDEFRLNLIRRNGWALRILGSADDNVFKQNDFEENVFDVGTNSRDASNTFEGNYWSRYTGYDLDKNGIGDVPYRPVAIFGYWVNQYSVLIMLLSSPVVEFLEVAERVFPVITPVDLKDSSPMLRPQSH